MSLILRRIVFYFLFFAFIIIAPIIVLYTAGYRWSPAQRKIVKTGALSITTIPPNAEITLNDNPTLTSSPALITNLLPGAYAIKIGKTGYYPWGKNLPVENKQTTFAHNVSLFKIATPEFAALQTDPPAHLDVPESFENFKVWYDQNLNKIIIVDNKTRQRLAELDANYAIWRLHPTPLLFAYSDHEVWQYNPKTQTTSLVTRLTETIRSILVLDSEETILTIISPASDPTPKKYTVRAIELDLRDQQNSWDLTEFEKIENAALLEDGNTLTVWGTYQGKSGLWQLPLR